MIWPNRYFLVPFNFKLSGNLGVLLHTGAQLFYWWLLFLICWYDLPFLCEKMSSDGVGRGNSTALPANCELCTAHLLHAGLHVHPPSAFAILRYCVIFFASCLDEESGSLAVVIIPCLLALSTVSGVALIFCSLHKNKKRMQSATAPATHGTHSNTCLSTKKQRLALLCVRLPRRWFKSLCGFEQANRVHVWQQPPIALPRCSLLCVPGKSLRRVLWRDLSFGRRAAMVRFVKVCWRREMAPLLLWWWRASEVQKWFIRGIKWFVCDS